MHVVTPGSCNSSVKLTGGVYCGEGHAQSPIPSVPEVSFEKLAAMCMKPISRNILMHIYAHAIVAL